MDTNWKSSKPQLAAPHKKQPDYHNCKFVYKGIALFLCLLATCMMVYGTLNGREGLQVLKDGERRYLNSQTFRADFTQTAAILEDYAMLLQSSALTAQQQQTASLWKQQLESAGLSYTLISSGMDWMQTLEQYTTLPAHCVIYPDGKRSIGINANYATGAAGPGALALEEAQSVPIAIGGLSNQQFEQQQSQWQQDYSTGVLALWLFFGGVALLICSTVYLVVCAGRRPGQQEVFLVWWDWLFLDLQAVAVFFLCAFAFMGAEQLAVQAIDHASGPHTLLLLVLCLAAVLLCLAVFTSCARRIKQHRFLRHTFLGWACMVIYRLLKRGMQAVSRAFRALAPTPLAVMLMVGICIALLILWQSWPGSFGAFLFAVLLALGCGGYLFQERAIAQGLKRMREGDLSKPLRQPRICTPPQRNMIDDVNNLAQGIQAAVREQVKAQSMKTELITNVSHDLKTPLTSILAYVDLLKQTELQPDQKEYVEVLSQKTQRLKRLTEDLFEAAKAASGNMPVHLERLDVCELIRQGTAELEDRITASGLDWRIILPDQPLFATADGRLLWRALENLCSNAIKYAQPGSRVYWEAAPSQEAGYIAIIMKNVSKDPLNISADALTQRFVRGDASRSTEGSGLGLSIVKNLTELMGGRFLLTIDGDLFKAMVEIPVSSGLEAERPEEQV